MASTDPSLLDITDKDVREKLSLWDRRGEPTAPLTDAQSDSVAEVRAAAETLPVPSEVRRAKYCLNACPAPRSGCILMNYHLMSVVSSSSSLKCGCVMPGGYGMYWSQSIAGKSGEVKLCHVGIADVANLQR